MEKDGTIERIKSCMLMESSCADIYHLLAVTFPEENELWNRLAADEERHAAVIARGMGFREFEDLAGFTVPEDLGCVRKAVAFADEIRRTLSGGTASLRDALEMAKRLQELKNDGYLHDLLEKEQEERIRKVFRRLFDMDALKLEILQAVITGFGFGGPKK